MGNIEKRIGLRITENRVCQKFTQSQLAEKIDVSVETISRIERGVTVPSLKTIEKIAAALNVSMKDLFDCESEVRVKSSDEKELAKLFGILRSLDKREIKLIYKLVKVVYKKDGKTKKDLLRLIEELSVLS